MPGADMRGADISNCRLHETTLDDRLSSGSIRSMESSELDVHNNCTRYAGMYFSTVEPLMHQYSTANENLKEIAENRYNDEKFKKLDLQEAAIIKQQKQVNDKYKTLGYLEFLTGSNVEYNILSAELTQLQDNKKKTQALSFEEDFDQNSIKYFMHPSVAELPLIMAQIGLIKFDPAYKRGSDKAATNFNFANIRNGLWDGAQVNGATFNYADLEGISLANAVIKQTSMQRANLDRAIIEGCEMIETDLTFAFMAEAKAKASNLKLKNSILQDVDARKIDLSGAIIDDLCKLEGVDLEKAVLREVKADRVNFVGAQLKEAILEGVNMQFSNLEDAVMLGVKANGVDMTGSNLININARGAKLQGAVLEGVVAHNADLTEAVMKGANLRGAKMHSVILEKVNLQKADLRNAELGKAKLSEAKMDKAKVNEATNLHGADITNVKGDLEHEDISGKKTEMSPEEKVRCDDQVHKAKQVGAVGKFFGNVCKTFGHFTKKAGEFIKQPTSEKWGRIIGATIGAVALGLFAASVVATGGASLAVLGAAVAGAAVVGAVAGHYAAKHTGLSTIAGIGGGLVAGGPVGAVLGGGVAIGTKQNIEMRHVNLTGVIIMQALPLNIILSCVPRVTSIQYRV
jgi:uncharacterized protein YjbI with pentapeptide repeats